ncbi:MAG: 50S ribosomal protein L6 [Candidatus Aenigmatarchaeota archaeon]
MEAKIAVPEGVEANIDGFKVRIKGKLGELERDFYNRGTANILKLEKSADGIKLSSKEDSKRAKALLGTINAHIKSMFRGVQDGYRYELKLHYIHFPMTLEQKGNTVVVKNYIGQKGNRKIKLIEGVDVKINKQDITVSGIDREKVGQTAANFEKATRQRKNDPRRFQDGVYIVQKALPMK